MTLGIASFSISIAPSTDCSASTFCGGTLSCITFPVFRLFRFNYYGKFRSNLRVQFSYSRIIS